MIRRLILPNTMNTRDLGGYPTSTGGYTRYNRFFRSDFPNLTDAGISMLRDRNITTIIDLRSDIEIERMPSVLCNRPEFHYRRCPLSGNGKIPAKESDIPASYLEMLSRLAIVYDIMKVFAAADTGILYHCTAGKDRTGVISALLLALADVPMADILADYQITGTYIHPMIERIRSDVSSLPAWLGQSDPAYLTGFFTIFLEEYRSVENYLSYIGLSNSEILNIKNKLVSD